VMAVVAGYLTWVPFTYEGERCFESTWKCASRKILPRQHGPCSGSHRQSVSDLRVPVIIFLAFHPPRFVAAWVLRERGIHWLPNIALALGHGGLCRALILPMTSEPDACRPGAGARDEQVAAARRSDRHLRRYPRRSGHRVYSHRDVLLYDANRQQLGVRLSLSRRPKTFFTDPDFTQLWEGSGARVPW